MRTHIDDVPHARVIAVFPLSGRMEDGYRIYIDESPEAFWHDTYIVVDFTHHADGYLVKFFDTFHEALNLVLRNSGWLVRAHEAREEELA